MFLDSWHVKLRRGGVGFSEWHCFWLWKIPSAPSLWPWKWKGHMPQHKPRQQHPMLGMHSSHFRRCVWVDRRRRSNISTRESSCWLSFQKSDCGGRFWWRWQLRWESDTWGCVVQVPSGTNWFVTCIWNQLVGQLLSAPRDLASPSDGKLSTMRHSLLVVERTPELCNIILARLWAKCSLSAARFKLSKDAEGGIRRRRSTVFRYRVSNACQGMTSSYGPGRRVLEAGTMLNMPWRTDDSSHRWPSLKAFGAACHGHPRPEAFQWCHNHQKCMKL